ncbi:MAG: hypothetical protein ACPIOQ_84665, partial [Promethearchaeia archaeon]
MGGVNGAAHKLGVRKACIYTIVNVLVSVEAASRQGRNGYIMLGWSRLPQVLQRLYMMGSPENKENGEEGGVDSQRKAKSEGRGEGRPGRVNKTQSTCHKFVRLCMHDRSGVVSLASAVSCISQDYSIRIGTKSIDVLQTEIASIAEVLCSLNLIEKTCLADGSCYSRKVAYKWKYPIAKAFELAREAALQEEAFDKAKGVAIDVLREAKQQRRGCLRQGMPSALRKVVKLEQ